MVENTCAIIGCTRNVSDTSNGERYLSEISSVNSAPYAPMNPKQNIDISRLLQGAVSRTETYSG